MKIQENVTIIPKRIIPETKITEKDYVCEICHSTHRSAEKAIQCEDLCKAKKDFLANNVPKYEVGSLIKTVKNELYVLYRYSVYLNQFSNANPTFRYTVYPYKDKEGDYVNGDYISESAISEVVLSKAAFDAFVSKFNKEGLVGDIILNHEREWVEIVHQIDFDDIVN